MSSISLLAVLGGTNADPAATAQTEDPALFAAALVSALQQLQPPVKPVPLPPVAVESEADGDDAQGEVTDGDLASGQDGATGRLGQMLTVTKGATDDVAAETEPPMVNAAFKPETETPRTTVDVVSDEPAGPRTAAPKAEKAQGEKPAQVAADQSDESATLVADPMPDLETPVIAAKAPDSPSTDDDRTTAAPVRVKTRTADRGEVLVGDWSPPPAAFTGWKVPAEPVKDEAPEREGHRQAEATEVPPARPLPVQPQTPTEVMVAQAPIVAAPVVSPAVTVEERRKPAPPLTAGPVEQTVDLDSSSDSVRQVQVTNARLATQLAELVGDHDVTDFRVELGKGKREPDATGIPVAKLPAEPPAPPSAQPVGKAPLESKGELVDQPIAIAPRPTRTETPGSAEPRSVTANRLLDLTEGPAIAKPLMAARAASGPIVPALRKELPAASRSETKTETPQPERARPRDDTPSEPPTGASGANQSQNESLTSRSEPATARGTREARNLPQEDTGNNRPAGSADRVTVQVSDSEGRQTRIRVSVLGGQVRAVIVPPDAESARQLEQRMDDLQTALARQGFASSRVSVQQAGENAVERNGASLAGMASGSEGKAATPGRDQPAGDQRQGRGQREQQHPGDGHRHPNGRSRDQGAEHRRRFTDL